MTTTMGGMQTVIEKLKDQESVISLKLWLRKPVISKKICGRYRSRGMRILVNAVEAVKLRKS